MKIYLAGQYNDPDYGKRQIRHDRITCLAGELMKRGHIVFSPINHSHHIASMCDLPKGWEFWEKQDISFIEWCDVLVVADFVGWEDSVGVQAEIEIAKELGKRIFFYSEMME